VCRYDVTLLKCSDDRELAYWLLCYTVIESLGYIPLGEGLGISSTTFTKCAPKVTEFAEMTQNNGHYAV